MRFRVRRRGAVGRRRSPRIGAMRRMSRSGVYRRRRRSARRMFVIGQRF